MKSISLTLFMLFITANVLFSQTSRFRQVKKNPAVQKTASPKAISTFVAFFEYVKNYEPSIVKDLNAQERWLSKSFRKVMMESDAAWVEYLRKNPTYKPDGPDNESFTGVWNQPTTYSIVSTRQYDYRDKNNPKALRTMIDVLYVWGKEDDLNNQYPGVKNLHTFILIFEEEAWKLDDIYIYNDEFTSSESLRQHFSTDRPQ